MDGALGKKIKASIDIGSNTVLLLVGTTQQHKVWVLYEEEHAPRLGRDVDAQKNLDVKAMERVIEVLKKYQAFLATTFPEISRVIVTATSAVRDAKNKQFFLNKIEEQTGFTVQVLSGEEEAACTFLGAQSVLRSYAGPAVVLDIGGGSTEVAIGHGQKLTDRFSFDMGCVRFTERYLQDDPPSSKQLQQCREAIEKTFQSNPFKIDPQTQLIGVAGTVTALAQIDLDMDRYDASVLNEYSLSLARIRHWLSIFETMRSQELLAKYPESLKGRADLFLAGLLILEGFMKRYSMDNLTVSTGGIRHGSLLL